MILRKPKLLIEMEYQGKDNDDLTSEDEDPLNWNPEILLEHAMMIFWKRSTKSRHEYQARTRDILQQQAL